MYVRNTRHDIDMWYDEYDERVRRPAERIEKLRSVGRKYDDAEVGVVMYVTVVLFALIVSFFALLSGDTAGAIGASTSIPTLFSPLLFRMLRIKILDGKIRRNLRRLKAHQAEGLAAARKAPRIKALNRALERREVNLQEVKGQASQEVNEIFRNYLKNSYEGEELLESGYLSKGETSQAYREISKHAREAAREVDCLGGSLNEVSLSDSLANPAPDPYRAQRKEAAARLKLWASGK